MKRILIVIFACFGLSGCPDADRVSNNKFIEIDDLKYRAGGATGALLGSVGYSSGRGFFDGKVIFDRKRLPEYKGLKIKEEGVVDYTKIKNFSSQVKAQVEGVIKKRIDAEAEAEGRTATDTEKEVKYHIISIQNSDDAVVQINNKMNDRAFKLMKAGGSKARLVTKIIIAFGHSESKKIATSVSGALSLTSENEVASIETDVTTENKAESSIKLSDGMIVGYSFELLCWHKDNGEVKILTTVIDRYGATESCPAGDSNPNQVE